MPGRIVRNRFGSGGLLTAAAVSLAIVLVCPTQILAEPFEVVGTTPSVLVNPAVLPSAADGRTLSDGADAVDGSPAFIPGPDRTAGVFQSADDSFATTAVACGHEACRQGGGCRCGSVCDAPGLAQYLMACHDRSNACWSLRTEALILWRSAPRSRPLFANVVDDVVAGTALDANQLQSDPLAAPRFTLLREDACGHGLEFGYIWAGNFYSERVLPFVPGGYATAPPSIYGNQWGPATGTSLDVAEAKLLANMQTAEVNYRERFLRGMAQFLVGFRWLQWNETLQMRDSFTNASGDEVVTGSDLYRTDCFNNLYGGQIGIDATLLGYKPGFHIDGLVKAGAFYNAASQRSAYAYADTSPDAFAAANRVGSPAGAAFVGEVGMTAVFPVHCNVDVRVGYFGLWIEGLAQPSNQLSGQDLAVGGTGAGTLDLTGGVVLQGVSLGVEGRW